MQLVNKYYKAQCIFSYSYCYAAVLVSTPFDEKTKTASSSLTPEVVRPLPKAPPRKNKTINKRKRQCAVLTSTPVKNALENDANQRLSKRLTKSQPKTPSDPVTLTSNSTKKRSTSHKVELPSKQVKPRAPPRSRPTAACHPPLPLASRQPLPRKPLWLKTQPATG